MKRNKIQGNPKLPLSSIVLYTVTTVIFLIAIASLVNNIILFKDNVAHYVEQGYPSADVVKQLIPSQLLPGIFEPIAVYSGIAVILFSAGLINQKISKILNILAKVEVDTVDTDIPEQVEAITVEAIEEKSEVTDQH
ncbi:MAG: hypothetical protein ACYDEJ_06200 [Desulfitobacteriaceae bacterium]